MLETCPGKTTEDLPLGSIDEATYYPWKQISVSIPIVDEPLPKDRRRQPWPAIRRRGWKVTTYMQYMKALLDEAQEDAARAMGMSVLQRGA